MGDLASISYRIESAYLSLAIIKNHRDISAYPSSSESPL